MAEQQIDYDKLAAQHDGKAVDFDAIAADVSKEPAEAPKGLGRQFADQFKANMDPAIGAAKGVGNTVFGLGKLAHDYLPGVGAVSDAIMPGAFNERPDALRPSNAAQQIGYTAEQIGEFFIPAGAAGKLGKLAEIAKSGGLTLAQTGSPVTAGASAALTAALPGAAKVAGRAVGALRDSAEASVFRALGPTKEGMKDIAGRLAPQMLERGVSGTRPAMLARAKDMTKTLGKELESAYATAAQQGQTIGGQIIRGDLELAKDALMVANAKGVKIPVPGTEPVLQKLDDLSNFVAQLGDDVPVDKAYAVKKVWDKIASKAGLYGNKSTASATDNAAAWATREGADSFRQLLADVPDVAVLNKEYMFWRGLKDVLKETERRTRGQMGGGGLPGAMASTAGAATGFGSGGLTGAFVGHQAGQRFVQLVRSPYWQSSVSAPLKDRMARALAAGDRGLANATVHNMLQALPAQARQAFAQ